MDLVDYAHVHGRLERVLQRLAGSVPGVSPDRSQEFDWILAEADGLHERARTIWETLIRPRLKKYEDTDGPPPWFGL